MILRWNDYTCESCGSNFQGAKAVTDGVEETEIEDLDFHYLVATCPICGKFQQ